MRAVRCLPTGAMALLVCVGAAGLQAGLLRAEAFQASLPDPATFVSTTVTYRKSAAQELKADLFLPKRVSSAIPVAIFLNGIGADWLRTHAQYQGWARAATGAGFAGVAMDSAPGAVESSFDDLILYLRSRAAELTIDPDTVVVWSCSSNVAAGLPLVMDAKRTYIKAAVAYYGSASLSRTRLDLPILVVRAGLDSTSLNQRIEEMVASLIESNAPVSVVNYAGGHHGFDLLDDSPVTRAIIADTLRFMKESAAGPIQKAIAEAVPEAEAAGFAGRSEWDRAAAAYARLAEARPRDAGLQRMLGDALAASGDHRRALDAYQQAIDLGDRNAGMISYAAALSSLKVGDREGAFRWLERLAPIPPMRERVKGDPAFAALRDDPRFARLLGD